MFEIDGRVALSRPQQAQFFAAYDISQRSRRGKEDLELLFLA